MSKFTDIATPLAQLGYRVFPVHHTNGKVCGCKRPECESQGKHPIFRGWVEKATTDPATLEKWGKKYPNANVGIATGEGSNLTAVDVDGSYGEYILKKLQEQYGPLPDTPSVTTGSGGKHLYFEYSPELLTSVKKLKDPNGEMEGGIDIRNNGGFVVAPGSIHEFGTTYAFDNDPSMERAPLPEWFLEELNKAQEKAPSNPNGTIRIGERHETLRDMAWAEWNNARSEDEVTAKILEINATQCEEPLPEKDVMTMLEATFKKVPKVPAYDKGNRRVIITDRDQVRDEAALVIAELVRSNKESQTLYRNNDSILELLAKEQGKVFRPLNKETLTTLSLKQITWLRQGKKNPKPSKPSNALVSYILNQPAPTGLPYTKGLVTWPMVSKDGLFRMANGYDVDTQRILDLPEGLDLTIPEKPSASDVLWARELLLDELLIDFPLVDAASKANTIAAMLQPMCLELIRPPYPFYLFGAPTPGSGKSLLVRLICLTLFDKEPAATGIGENDAEVRKRLSGQLFTLPNYIFIDNLPPKLKTHSLAMALTAPVWSDRILGVTEVKHVDVSCLWLATGNNVGLTDELARRTIPVDIDPEMENPGQRKNFKHPNIVRWTKEHRAELLRALMILIRNWFVKSCPEGTQPFGSYETYAKVIGGILDASGIPGFLLNRTDDFLNQDDETYFWYALIQQWKLKRGGGKATSGQLLDDLEDEFKREYFPDGAATSLGMKLARAKNRVFNGYKIKEVGRGPTGGRQYMLQRTRKHKPNPHAPDDIETTGLM